MCEFPTIDFSLGNTKENIQELQRLVNEGEPIRLKRVMSSINATFLAQFSVEDFVKRVGSDIVTVGDVPYAGYFGKHTSQMPLNEFYENHVKIYSDVEASAAPLYVFQKSKVREFTYISIYIYIYIYIYI